jgi:hypothetical protein
LQKISPLKRLLPLIVVLLLVKPILPVLDYMINYDYIVKELCENKEKPEMKCNGKCQLMKGLADASETENSSLPTEKKHQSSVEILFLEPLESYQLHPLNEWIQKNNYHYSSLYTQTATYAFLRPPIC